MPKSDQTVDRILRTFASARSDGELAYFVGAGVSRDAPANRPLAGEISSAIGQGLWAQSVIARGRWRVQTLARRAQGVRFESLMQILADTTGNLDFLHVLHGGRPNAIHKALGRALQAGCPVLTTNFDRLIEKSVSSEGYPCLRNSDDFESWEGNIQGTLAKLHGSLDDPDNLCATIRKVGHLGVAFMWDPPRGELLARIRQELPLVVLGYSGADDADILPRLRITESDQPILWVFHSDSDLRIPSRSEVRQRAVAPGLSEFLVDSESVVLVGRARDVVSRLEMKKPTRSGRKGGIPASRLALRIVRHLHLGDSPFLADFLISRILYEAGYIGPSRDLSRSIRRGTQGNHEEIALRCLMNEATAETDLGNWASADRKLGVLVPSLLESESPALVDALINKAIVLRHLDELAASEAVYRQVLEISENVDSQQRQWARCAANFADLLFQLERMEEAQTLLSGAHEKYQDIGDYAGLAPVYGTLGKILFSQGEGQNAIQLFQMGLQYARVTWDRLTEARILNNLGTVYRTLMMIDEAVASYAAAEKIGLSMKDPEPVTVSQMGMVTVYIAKEQLAEAIRLANACLQDAENLGLSDLAVQTQGNLALALLGSGRYQDALARFQTVLDNLELRGPAYQAAFTLENIGVCHLRLGRRSEARHAFEVAEARYVDLGMDNEAQEIRNSYLTGHRVGHGK